MECIARPSPNYNDRKLPVSMLVMHYTGMQTGGAALERLCDRAAEVSAHYVVEEDGHIFQLVDEAYRAWHAGRGCWRGCEDVNSASIGIEIVNGGHDFGLPDFPDVQIQAVIALSQSILSRHAIAPGDIIGHSDLAPDRKQDPGEKFPWQRLAAHGIGIWPVQTTAFTTDLALKDESDDVYALGQALVKIGYHLQPARFYDQNLEMIVAAFQRRYRPERIDGVADGQTRSLIATLAEG